MQKYILQNGWTRARLKAAVRAGNNGTVASNGDACAYLALDGNRCVVGALFPADVDEGALRHVGDAGDLLVSYPELEASLPLDVVGLLEFQELHDRYEGTGHHCADAARVRQILARGLSLHEAADAWIDDACLESTHT